ILGVTTYYGFDGQRVSEEKAKDALTKEVPAIKKSRDFNRWQALLFKRYGGHATAEDQTEFATLDGQKSSFSSEKGYPEVDKLVGTVETTLVRGEGKKDFEPYTTKVARLEKELSVAQDLLGKSDANLAKTRADLEREKADNQAEVVKLMDNYKKA